MPPQSSNPPRHPADHPSPQHTTPAPAQHPPTFSASTTSWPSRVVSLNTSSSAASTQLPLMSQIWVGGGGGKRDGWVVARWSGQPTKSRAARVLRWRRVSKCAARRRAGLEVRRCVQLVSALQCHCCWGHTSLPAQEAAAASYALPTPQASTASTWAHTRAYLAGGGQRQQRLDDGGGGDEGHKLGVDHLHLVHLLRDREGEGGVRRAGEEGQQASKQAALCLSHTVHAGMQLLPGTALHDLTAAGQTHTGKSQTRRQGIGSGSQKTKHPPRTQSRRRCRRRWPGPP